MENEQESSKVSSTTKSFRRRQRRKEAAALKKLSTEVQSEKDNIPEQNQNKPSGVIEGICREVENLNLSKNVLNETTGLSSSPNSLTLTSKIKNKPHCTQESIVESRENPVSTGKRRRRCKRKAIIGQEVDHKQDENIDGAGQRSTESLKTDIQHTLHCNCSKERCTSETEYLSLLNESHQKESEKPFPVIGNYFEQPVVIANLIYNSRNECSSPSESAPRELDGISNKKTGNHLKLAERGKTGGKSKERIETENKPREEINEKMSDSGVEEGTKSSNVLSGEIKSGSVPEELLKDCKVGIDEEKIPPSIVFEGRKVNSSVSDSESGVTIDTLLTSAEVCIHCAVSSENNNNMSEKDSRKVKPDSTSGSPKKSPYANIKDTSREMEITSSVRKTETEGSKVNEKEKSKEQIKAEREARKMAKLAKKQTVKVMNVVEEEVKVSSSDGNKTPAKSDDGESKNEQNDNAPKTAVMTNSSKVNESDGGSKSKVELRAERRAKQEAQRAAKAAAVAAVAAALRNSSEVQTISKIKEKPLDVSNSSKATMKQNKTINEAKIPLKRKSVEIGQGTKLLNRMGWDDSKVKRKQENTLQDTHSIHPAIVQLGTRYADRIISGSNARCIAFVQSIKKVIEDYQTPPQKELGRDLESRLITPSLAYLEAQRPHAVSVSNASRYLKWQLTQLQSPQLNVIDGPVAPTESKVVLTDDKAKHQLIEGLDSYVWEKIEVAEQAVCDSLKDKIKDGDVILTYGCSYLLQRIFIVAKKAGTKFKVIVVDGRPWKEGREMLRCLVALGIHCSYVLLSAASSVIRQVNKVLVGAHALLSNGYVMSRVGVSQVALLASAHNVPVLVACETHKFCERVQSDSFVYNEMGEPDGLAQLIGDEISPLSDRKKSHPFLSLLNLSYDVTPPELVTAVATELAVLPCTSVPVVLRVRPTEPVAYRH